MPDGTPGDIRRRPPASAVRDLVWLAQHYPLRWLVRVCPAPLLGGVRAAVQSLHHLLRRSTRRRVTREMTTLLGVPEHDARQLATRFIGHMGYRAYLDLRLFARRAPLCDTPPVVAGRAHLDAALAAGNGVLFVSAHRFANLAGLLTLRERGYPALVLKTFARRRPPTPAWRAAIDRRHRINLDTAFPERADPLNPDTALVILRRLRGGGIVSIHPDIWRNTAPVSFLRAAWPVNGALLEVARLTGCAVLPLDCAYDGHGLRIEIGPPLALTLDGSREACAATNFPILVAEIERQVRSRPDQWGRWGMA